MAQWKDRQKAVRSSELLGRRPWSDEMDERLLTPWFDDRMTKPARPGVYMLMDGNGKQAGYQKWDGVAWGPWHMTAESAAKTKAGDYAKAEFQRDPWRGLRKRPNAKLTGQGGAHGA